MPKKSKTLCVDDLRHAEYYGMQEIFDELYQKSQNGEVFNNLLDFILSKDNILLAYRNIKARVRLKHHKYVVQSAICDKKVEIEREKLVEQAKNIAKPREKRSCLAEIQLFNSMVLGIQNYYQLATCISLDCRDFHRRIMTVLTNRLNTETGCMLLREGGTATEAEKERFRNPI